MQCPFTQFSDELRKTGLVNDAMIVDYVLEVIKESVETAYEGYLTWEVFCVMKTILDWLIEERDKYDLFSEGHQMRQIQVITVSFLIQKMEEIKGRYLPA